MQLYSNLGPISFEPPTLTVSYPFLRLSTQMLTVNIVSLQVNNEPYVDRVISHSVTGRDDIFRERLRLRDSGCVISGKRNRLVHRGIWAGFEAAHVWPLHKGQEWINQGIYRWITDADPLDPDQGARMNSPQNGMILDASLHALFDKYLIGVDPDVSMYL